MGMDRVEELREHLKLIEERVEKLEKRLDAVTGPTSDSNIRASLAQALRGIAEEIEDEELVPAGKFDPNEEED